MDMNLVKLAVDCYKGSPAGNFSMSDNMETLKNALIELNGGSTKLDYKAIRDGKCNGLFSLVEEILTRTVVEGLPENSPIFDFVEEKAVPLGDKATFYVPDNSLLTVADIASGTQGIRRQRVEFGKNIQVDTQLKAIKIYEELDLVLAGRIDFNEFIDRVSKSFMTQINNDMITTFMGTYSKVVAPYQVSGTYSEATLLTLIDHVEAATGMTAKILGSRGAVRKINTAVISDKAKDDMYNMGYIGSFNGTPVFALKNGHKIGGTDFILNDTDLYVVAGDDRFIKLVIEGDVTMLMGDPTTKADFSQEFTMLQKYGLAVVLSTAFGVYRMTTAG